MVTESLDSYRQEVLGNPRPTAKQVAGFVEYAANAHSWYKHLPPVETASFCFYLDPAAGMELIQNAQGEVEVRPRDPANEFHYNWMPTDEYRRRFGVLEFSTDRGSRFLVGGEEGTIFVGPSGRALPPAIAEAGTVGWNAVVHDRSTTAWWWQWKLGNKEVESWPEESGGVAVIAAIADAIEGLPVVSSDHPEVDTEIRRLVLPEQNRQKRLAEDAIQRVLAIVYEGSARA